MANVASTNYTNQIAAQSGIAQGSSRRSFLSPASVLHFKETITAGAGDAIQIAVLRAGYYVVPSLSQLGAPVAGTFTLRKKSTAGTTTTIATAAPGATTKGAFAAAAWNTDIAAATFADGDVLELVVGANAITAGVVVLDLTLANAYA